MNSLFRNISLVLLGSFFTMLIISQGAFREPLHPTRAAPVEPVIPVEMDFAGEPVPLERWEVKERIDRELLYNFHNRPNILYMLKLSTRYFPVISARLKANGVPDDFKFMCVAESNLEPMAISRSGAVSFWQFMDATAPGYQLLVNQQVDQRYDLERATDAACKYLKSAYARFGSWTAAAAAYNCGIGRYGSLAAFQKTNHYYDLSLPEETNRYVFRILTFKHLLTNADELGFKLKEEEKYKEVPYRELQVTKEIPDLAAFALQNGTNYKMLKLLNPWIKGRSLTVRPKESLRLKIPR